MDEILGPFTRREAFSLVLALAIIGWATTPLHGINEAWTALRRSSTQRPSYFGTGMIR